MLPFKMLTAKRILSCVRHQDWFAAIDLKDAYFHVSILPRHRPFLWFAFEVLGISVQSPPLWASPVSLCLYLMEGAPAPVWEKGICILNYLNDWLIISHSRDLVLQHLSHLGLRVNWEKSTVVANTDAFKTGWGAVCNGQAASDSWIGPRLQWHINYLELLAVLLALRRFLPMLRDKHVLVHMNNIATVVGAELYSRCALTTAHSSRRMTTPSPGGPAHLEPIRDLFASPESSQCQLFYSLTEALAHSWPWSLLKYTFPPVSHLAQTLCKIREDEEQVLLVIGPPEPGLPSRSVEPHFPRPMINTITQARAPSMRQAYALKWGLFIDWCSSRREDPQRCSVRVVLSFLQEKLERRLSLSTLKVYVAAIAAYHDAVDRE
ncbi:hypothetical protein M9458_029663, partial [Cirrhinus mrigala]